MTTSSAPTISMISATCSRTTRRFKGGMKMLENILAVLLGAVIAGGFGFYIAYGYEIEKSRKKSRLFD